MNIEQQVCSLELAKRLKALGVKQKGIFYWNNGKLACPQYQEYNIISNNWFSAFTVAELGEMLPKVLQVSDDYVYYYTQIPTKDMRWFIEYRNSFNALHANVHDTNEANARAEMLVYLIENGLMEAPK